MGDSNRRTSKQIADSIRRGTRLAYQEETEYKLASFTKPVNYETVEYAILNELEDADYFLLECVYRTFYTTPDLLLFIIKSGAERGDRKCQVIRDAGYADSLAVLNRRLRRLAYLGFLFCREACHTQKKDIQIFSCTPEGFRAFTSRLSVCLNYNHTIVYKTLPEVFGAIACARAVTAFSENPYCKSAHYVDMFSLHNGKRVSQEELSGRVVFQKPDSLKSVQLLIEAAYFDFEKNLFNEEEWNERVTHRIGLLQNMAQEIEKNGNAEAYVLFLVENAAGLNKLRDIVLKKGDDFFFDRCFFSAENAIYDSSAAGGDGTDALLCMFFNKNKELKYRQKDVPETV